MPVARSCSHEACRLPAGVSVGRRLLWSLWSESYSFVHSSSETIELVQDLDSVVLSENLGRLEEHVLEEVNS